MSDSDSQNIVLDSTSTDTNNPLNKVHLRRYYKNNWKGSQRSFCKKYRCTPGNFSQWLLNKKNSPTSENAVLRYYLTKQGLEYDASKFELSVGYGDIGPTDVALAMFISKIDRTELDDVELLAKRLASVNCKVY